MKVNNIYKNINTKKQLLDIYKLRKIVEKP